MTRIRVVADSACDIPEEIARRLEIDVVSLSIRFGDEEFTDRSSLTPSEFWAKCKASKVLPETAAPSPGAFQAAYQRAKDDGCDGVIVLDTLAVSMAQGLLAMDVAERAKIGAGLEDLVAYAESLKHRVGVCAMLDTLEHLVKGGRVGGARALLGQVLSIKPLLELKDGVVAEAGRQRTRAKALTAIAAVARGHAPLRRLAVVHGDAADVEAFATMVADIPTEFPLVIADIGPVVGTHGGPGIIGLCWVGALARSRYILLRERIERAARPGRRRQG